MSSNALLKNGRKNTQITQGGKQNEKIKYCNS